MPSSKGFACIYCGAKLKSSSPITVNAHNRVCEAYKQQTAAPRASSTQKHDLFASLKVPGSLKAAGPSKAIRGGLRGGLRALKGIVKKDKSTDDVSMRTAPSTSAASQMDVDTGVVDEQQQMYIDDDELEYVDNATARADASIPQTPPRRTPTPPPRTPTPPIPKRR
ncbi:hypothetical protein BDZ89DRAFT_1150909, partial [Hymenopellis radicata]